MIIFTGIILTLLILYFIRDIKELLKINSIITIISGYLIIIINIIITMNLKKYLSFISITKITNIIGNAGTIRGLRLILFGAIQLIAYTMLNIISRYKKKKN